MNIELCKYILNFGNKSYLSISFRLTDQFSRNQAFVLSLPQGPQVVRHCWEVAPDQFLELLGKTDMDAISTAVDRAVWCLCGCDA